ncbi:N-methylhydantoinase B [Paraburkholderia caribensis MBA4]|uniref:N-methylhydantoinase B n=1 Tax=Paraburkholderia caribensis MBA4 TaxID=1323664 RepID=A0A0P0RIH6_9BURK|nr:hydantoinase B/oxoprolinase family protein [Paraburkholderia caribensis]ALL68416.1 N-methylhydantoinase B [Paraburkholderia caribensis MBA4]
MKSDLIQLQVMWSRLLAIVEEQAQTLIRTAFSVSTREGGDVSAGVFDVEGRMLAQAVTGTPGHINSMAMAVPHFVKRFPPAEMREGDVFLTNDPWQGTGHLHDFTFVTPAFKNGKVVAFFACTSHVVDIGGVGFSPEGRTVYHEGLRVPIMRFADEGKTNEWLVELVRNNVREATQVVGDLYALAACNDNAVKSLTALMREYEISTLDVIRDFIFENTRKAMLDAFALLPRKQASNAMRTDGFDKPVDLACTVSIEEERIVVDFDGTSPVSEFGINCPLCYTAAYASFAVKCVVAPKVPNNSASLDMIVVTAPENTIVNALFPSAVAVRSVVGHLVPDVVFGAMNALLPGRAPAEGAGSLWGVKAGAGMGLTPATGVPQTSFMMMSLHSGGMGARSSCDGLSATPFPSGVKNIPVEVTEAITPLVIWKKELRQDSGGIGQYRGGLGQTMVVGSRENAPFAILATFDRIHHAPRGRSGGGDGANGVLRLESGEFLKPKGRQVIPAGERVVLDMPGGGGFGAPEDRPLELIEADLQRSLISWEAAVSAYGVARDTSGKLVRSA